MTATESEPLDARVAGALRRAGELEAADWAAAIDVLAEANRAAPSAELERALVALRHRCATRVSAADPGARLAGGAVAPVGPSGLPETDLAALDARSLRAALLGHGSLLVRGAITREDADGASPTRSTGAGRSARARSRPRPPTPAIWEPFWPADGDGGGEQWVRGIRNWVRAAGGVLLCDSPEIQFRILDLYRQIGLQTVVTDYLGGRPVLSANKCTLRRVSPETDRRLAPGRRLPRRRRAGGQPLARAHRLRHRRARHGPRGPPPRRRRADRRTRRVLRLGRERRGRSRRRRGPAASCGPSSAPVTCSSSTS